MAFHRKRREEPRVELTPMVDVVFNLLIFFMISTTFVHAPGIDVHLPESSAERTQQEPEEVKVYLSKAGDIFIGEEKVTLDGFQEHLKGFGERAGDTTFVLLADREAMHGRVVQLMDVARESGFQRLAIATETRSTP